MATIRGNLAANLAGRGWSAVLNVLFPPLYAKLLGIEAYGIVGLYASLVGVLGVLDLGLSTTMNREMARLSAESNGAAMRATVRTFEFAFWSIALVASAGIFLLAPFIATSWVHAEQTPIASVTMAIRICAFVFVLQWPGSLYTGGLVGLERQVTSNVLLFIFATLRLGGGAAILMWVDRSVQAFFLWQALVFALQTIATRWLLGRALPAAPAPPRFSLSILKGHWRLSTGISVVTLLSMVLTNVDKLVVSKLLPLRDFGYYTLSWTVGLGLYSLIGPVFVSVFPRMTRLVEKRDENATRELYHGAAQLMAVLVLPPAVVIALFSREVVVAWTGDTQTAGAIYRIVALLTMGSALNGLMNVPYALQLAHGWTRLAGSVNAVGVVVLVPVIFILTRAYGGVGAAVGWLILNAGYVLVTLPLQHRRLLRGDLWRWWASDTALPLGGALLAALALRAVAPPMGGRFECLAWVVGGTVLAYLASALASPMVRARSLRTVCGLVRRPA